MPFLPETWKAKVTECLWERRLRVEQARPAAVYSALSAAALWPLAQAAQSTGMLPVALALGNVVAGVGGNLIAEQIQRWHDQAHLPSEADVATWVTTHITTNTDLRQALDTILEQLQVISQARECLQANDRTWFVQTLRTELAELGNLTHFEAHLTGDGAVAQGTGARAVGKQATLIEGDMIGDYIAPGATKIVHPPGTTPPAGLLEAYLSWVMEQVCTVPLAGVDPKSVREETRRDLELAAVYTALLTQHPALDEQQERLLDRDIRRLSALEMLNTHTRLALLGDPGSGKSTFVNFVALCMAGELLGHPDANLSVLSTPVPAEEAEARRRNGVPPQPWQHGALLPIRVILREFVARGLPPAEQPATARDDTLWQFIVAELPAAQHDFAQPLRDTLLNDGGLLLLDGLDEVPEADQRRAHVKAAVEQFAATFSKVRILVTSRTYAYQRQDWKLRRFAEAVLAPFATAQMQHFVQRWYAYVGPLRGLSVGHAQGSAAQLTAIIRRNPRLYALATRPLLLTLMASLHAWRGGSLPEQREELYADAVDLLLRQWEDQKVMRQPDGTYAVIQPSLREWLQVDQQAMRQVLNQLAFEAHHDQPTVVGTADIPETKLVMALMHLSQNPAVRPALLIEYLRDRAGVLEPRGVGVYAFPHRTFQEYLAACHLTDVGFEDELPTLLRAEPNRWREVTLLTGAKATRGLASAAWTLAEALCFAEPPRQRLAEEAGYWGALLAAQVLVENRSLERIAEHHRAKVERIRTWLVRTLEHNALSPVERAQSGNALGVIGDPRFHGKDVWYLPNDEKLGFIEIPAGAFIMGSTPYEGSSSERPQHEVSLPCYFIARYPVTVAQFRAFVDDSKYAWRHKDFPQGEGNSPVVAVSWYDALAYCEWLTEKLQVTSWPLATLLREGWCITLPGEAEWEKAARGTDGCQYPWGNEPDPNLANYDTTGIGTTSAVGCFAEGKSPYNVEDMSGNVWEWTRSLWGYSFDEPTFKYPYRPDDGREDLRASEELLRVLRGSAFWVAHQGMRCAARLGDVACVVHSYLGFRVALAGPP
jgi:formylglycine-generating enzyme required for sulfatase activity